MYWFISTKRYITILKNYKLLEKIMKFQYEYEYIKIDHKYENQAYELAWFYKNRNLEYFV